MRVRFKDIFMASQPERKFQSQSSLLPYDFVDKQTRSEPAAVCRLCKIRRGKEAIFHGTVSAAPLNRLP
jgi:hypothetical protein